MPSLVLVLVLLVDALLSFPGSSLFPSPDAGDVVLIATAFPTIFGPLPTNDDGDTLVCVYGCVSVVAVACATSCPGSGTPVDPILDLGLPDATVDFSFSPLSSEELECDVAAVVGPFVTPTIEFPAMVNQNMAGPICMTEGEQLVSRERGGGERSGVIAIESHCLPACLQGALVATSAVSECCLDPPCQQVLSLTAMSVEVEKSFMLPFMPSSGVSSINLVDFAGDFETIITQPGFDAAFSLYQWTSTYFNCPVRRRVIKGLGLGRDVVFPMRISNWALVFRRASADRGRRLPLGPRRQHRPFADPVALWRHLRWHLPRRRRHRPLSRMRLCLLQLSGRRVRQAVRGRGCRGGADLSSGAGGRGAVSHGSGHDQVGSAL